MQGLVVAFAFVLVVGIVGRIVVGRIAHRNLVVDVPRPLRRTRSDLQRLVVVLVPVLAFPVVLVRVADGRLVLVLVVARSAGRDGPRARPTLERAVTQEPPPCRLVAIHVVLASSDARRGRADGVR